MTGFFLDYQVPGERELSDVAASLRGSEGWGHPGLFLAEFFKCICNLQQVEGLTSEHC